MQCQAVVDRSRKFIDLSVDLSAGMPGSTNDAPLEEIWDFRTQ